MDVKHVGALSAILDTEFRDILPGDVYSSFIPVVKDAISTERYYPDFFLSFIIVHFGEVSLGSLKISP